MRFAMLTGMAMLAILIASVSATEHGCGGLVEGDNGKFHYSPGKVSAVNQADNCVWLVRSYGAAQIKITLDDFSPAEENGTVVMYPDSSTPGEIILNPITLNSEAVEETFGLAGSTVLIILPQSNSTLAFSWDSIFPDGCNPNESVTVAEYIEKPSEGELIWTPARRQEKLWWIISTGVRNSAGDALIEWRTQVDLTDCDGDYPCTCLSFLAFELSSQGYLLPAAGVCGRSSSGVFQMQSSPLLVAASANTTQRGESRLELHLLEGQGQSTTTPTTTSTTTPTTTSTTTPTTTSTTTPTTTSTTTPTTTSTTTPTTTSTTTPTTTSKTTTTTTTAPPGAQPSIYIATYSSGLIAFSLETTTVKQIVPSAEDFDGVTFDSWRNKIYWSTRSAIHRGNIDGTAIETVYSSTQYKHFHGLAFDWISGNVYVVTNGGYILVCGAEGMRTFSCFPVLSGLGQAIGISLNPNEGTMYWSSFDTGSIHKASMDGSNPVTLITGLNELGGITIDLSSRRLYWAEYQNNRIRSSDLDGQDVQTTVQLVSGSGPWGVAVLGDVIYWGNYGDRRLQRGNKDGTNIETLYPGTSSFRLIAVVPPLDQPRNRTNDCEGRSCTKLCVLTPATYRCLD